MVSQCYLFREIYYGDRHNLTTVMLEQIEIEDRWISNIAGPYVTKSLEQLLYKFSGNKIKYIRFVFLTEKLYFLGYEAM
jgi:hypothetical protein